jgi:hypothetical protein
LAEAAARSIENKSSIIGCKIDGKDNHFNRKPCKQGILKHKLTIKQSKQFANSDKMPMYNSGQLTTLL